MHLYLNPPHVQLNLRNKYFISYDTLNIVVTNVSAPFQISCAPKSPGLMPNEINLFFLTFTMSLKILFNISYYGFPSKILHFPFKILGVYI